MSKALRSSAAEQDLVDIAYQIAIEDGRPDTALKIVDELIEKCNFFAEYPELGTKQDFLFEGCRIGRYKRWIIFYRIETSGIQIVRILDGSRDYPRLF